jgi:hypothetical protein
MPEPKAENDGLCHLRRASDGTLVRVRGDLPQETLDRLTAKVREMVDNECGDVSTIAMLEIAQRIHGRETYVCRQPRGHDGDHGTGRNTWSERTSPPVPSTPEEG